MVEKEDKWTDEDRVVGRSCLVIDEIGSGGLDFWLGAIPLIYI